MQPTITALSSIVFCASGFIPVMSLTVSQEVNLVIPILGMSKLNLEEAVKTSEVVVVGRIILMPRTYNCFDLGDERDAVVWTRAWVWLSEVLVLEVWSPRFT